MIKNIFFIITLFYSSNKMSTPTLLSIKSICDQRRQQMLHNTPPPRINLVSPYETTNYTKFDLDMRRKAEVLKYKKGSTKGNTLTKKQQWAQIVHGNYQNIPTSYLKNSVNKYDDANDDNIRLKNDCSDTSTIRTPLSASNVPPDPNVPFLYNDEKVPLYNYLNPISTRAYGFENLKENEYIIFNTYILYNTICERNTPTKFASILFTDNANQTAYTISIQNIPLAIYMQGVLIDGEDINETDSNTKITNIQLEIYYNNKLVPQRSIYQYTYSPSSLLKNYTLNIKANTTQSGNTFKGIQYIGTMSISNILLYASPGFIYDFKLNISLTGSTDLLPSVTSMHKSIITNITSDQISLHSCSIEPVLTPDNIPTMTIS